MAKLNKHTSPRGARTVSWDIGSHSSVVSVTQDVDLRTRQYKMPEIGYASVYKPSYEFISELKDVLADVLYWHAAFGNDVGLRAASPSDELDA